MFNTVPDTKGNPIFSSYSVRNADFNENMDEYIKAPNDIYIEEQIKKAKTEAPKTDINKDAMDKIEELPAFLKEEFEYVNKKPEWLVELEKNVATQEDIEEWKKQGSMGIGDVAKQGKKWGYMIPFAGSSAETTMVVRNANTLRRLKNGEEVSDVDAELLYDFLREEKEKEVRGVTFAGKTLDGVRTGVGYLAEFGLGLLAVGADGIGLAAIAKTLGDIGAKKAARKAVQAVLKEAAIKSAAPAAVKTTVPLSTAKKIYKDTLVKTTGTKALANVGLKEAAKETAKGLPKAIGTSAAFGNTVMLPHTINEIASKQLATGIYITDFGDAVLTDSENLALSIMKAIGSSTFEVLTETAGWTFSPIASYFAKPVQKVLPKKFFTEFDKLVSSRYGVAASEALRKYGYDGILEEMGEEVLNRFLCQVFGINGLDEYNFEGFMNNVLYANDLSQWGVEALSFAAVGGGARLAAGGASKVGETWKKKQYEKDVAKIAAKANSLEKFYLEQGMIKIEGSQSLAEQELRKVWSEQNVDENLQNEVLKNMSETEIRSELKKAIEEKAENSTPEQAAERIEKDLTKKFMDNKIFAKEKDAKTVAALFTAPLQKLSETTGISLEELMQEEMPEIQREAEQSARDNGRYIHTDGRIEEIFNEIAAMPDDFSDEQYLTQLMDEAEILSKIRDGNITAEDFDKVRSLINALDYAEYTEFANELRELSYNQTGQLFQSESLDKNLIDNFGMSANELSEMVKADIENILVESGVEEDEFKLVDIRVYGSYVKNKNKKSSDLDFVVQYTGSMREDDAFNMLHEDGLSIEDNNGRKVTIDINPIREDVSGTIEEYLKDDVYFQAVNTAGADGSAEISAAKKEWEEKGVESSYFKKWFGDSKVVDEDGKPLVVYHGSEENFNIFDREKLGAKSMDIMSYLGFHFTPNKEMAERLLVRADADIMPVYLNIQNPYTTKESEIVKEALLFAKKNNKIPSKVNLDKILKMPYFSQDGKSIINILSDDASKVYYDETPLIDYKDITMDYLEYLKDQGFDGIKYINEIEWADENRYDYIAFEPEQIKSINNRGTFDVDNPNIYYQSQPINANNLIMAHATKAERIDDIIETGVFVAPSMSITKKGSGELSNRKFGDVLFVRNPRRIDFQNDNIYDRDIYSPRLPAPDYEMPNGVIVDAYQRASMQREWQYNQEKFINRYGKSFDEYFKDAKKVLFLGYTPSGNRRYKPYKPNFLLEYLKSNKLVNGENVQYGFSNFLAKFSKQQLSKYQLKETAEKGLSDREENIDEYEKLRDAYGNLTQITGFREMAKEEYQEFWTFEEALDDILYAVATNNNKKLYKYIDKNKLTKEVKQELKNFTDKALALPRSYFEAKPLRKVDLSEFPYAVTQKGTLSAAQKKGLKDWGVTVIEYEEGNINAALKQVETSQPEIYFQSAYTGSAADYDTPSTDFIGTGEGAFAHGWGLYFAANRDVAERYREILNSRDLKYDGKTVGLKQQYNMKNIDKYGKKGWIEELNKQLADTQKELSLMENAAAKNNGNKIIIDAIEEQKKIIAGVKEDIKISEKIDAKKISKGQVFEVDIPENKELLNENKTISKQNKKIREAVVAAMKEAGLERFTKISSLDALNGGEVYNMITSSLGANPEKASKLLLKHGIKGITYDGRQDGRCYVVFDDKAVKVLEKYYQSREDDDAAQANLFYDNITPRKLRNMNIKGAFVPAENLIELFKNADESTIIHEFAHWWLSRLEKYAENNEELALDLAAVRKFVKNDGGKFTREQHEKFAVGFEAYIRNGSARNNRLKRIFEDFKNALIQIYDSIKWLIYTENGNEYSFTEDDVANLERLFERLLTTENERIKKTVFDRCDDINERIKEIKARQEEEMKELDEIWKDNIAANNRASDKKRKVSEYLELAETAVSRVPKEVKEMKQRYKDVTLSILSVATGMKKNVIANPRNWEKVQAAFEGTDRITASDGMHPEWLEFYSDTGVSYDNDEVGGDNELAQQAYEVMVDGTYNFGNMNEDDIGRFYGKFEYLYNKVQSLKGEEKAVAFEALCSLFGDMPEMPDEVTADIVEKLGKVETEYEEGQKEDFNRKRYPSIPVVQQLQFYVTNKLSELKVYDPNVRYKVRISKSHSLYKAIKHATSVNSAKKIVRKINEYVISDLENQAKTILHKEIQKQVRVNSKLVKIGSISKGKFDWKTNTIFAELVEINKYKQKEAFKEFSAMLELDKAAAGEDRESNDENPISTPEMKTDFQSNLKRKFLEYRSSKIKDLNLLATRSLLEDIMTLKFEGRRAKDAYELEKQLQKDNMKTDLVERVRELKDKKAAKNIAKFVMGETIATSEKSLVNWETALNALFGKEVSQRYSLLKLESDAEVYAYKRYADFCKKAIEVYGLNNTTNFREKAWNKFNEFVDFANNQPLVNLLQEYEEEVYNYKEVTYSKETGKFIETGVQLSRAEIITLYAWSMNEELEQRLFTQYGLHQVQHMFEQVLSEEDKQFAWLLIDTCEAMYEDNNEVFIRTMGLSLPKVENYFPSKTVRVGSEIDMLHENVVRSSNPSFIKQRKTCSRIKMKPEQPLSILLPHINKTARYVILSERLNYLNAIFKDGTVRAAIKEVFDGVETPDKVQAGTKVKGKKNKKQRTVGDRIHDALLNQLGSSTFENYVRGINVGKSFMDYVATNYITSRIGGNFKVMFGQLTSMVNYCENMPTGLWAKGFAECLKHPKETIKFMLENCDYLNARLAGNSMNEVMLKITDEADRFRSLRNFCTTNTKYGDLFAIAFGGKPYVDYLISQGLSKEEAIQKFVEDTMRSQQAGQASATSVWQKKQSEHPLTRMIFAFNNTTLQYERKFVDAMASKARGDISTKEFVKALLIYKVFNPILFTTFLTNLSFMTLIRGLMGDDEDGVEKFGVDVISSILFANLAAYGYLGMGLSTIGSFAMTLVDKKEYKPFLKTVPIIGDLEEIGRNILLKNEVTVGDWVDAMALVTDDLTGIPATRFVNSATGLGDMAQGDFGVGALKLFGYGNYRANVAAKGKPPEKK